MNQKNTPDLERRVATDLLAILEGVPIGTEFVVEPAADLCASLEFFIPQVLRQRYAQWQDESLDGVHVACARKAGPCSARIGGTCILITDQTVTPFLLDAAVSPGGRSIASLRVCVGETGGGALGISGPDWGTSDSAALSMSIADRIDSVDWSFEVSR